MNKAKKVIWLLSAYRSDSHATWADWLVKTFDQFEWRLMELPGRHFRWRIRGNPLSWLNKLPGETPDLIIATSMVDLSTLKGLHPRLAAIPCIYYFHENQFAYPVSAQQIVSIEPEIVQLYGSLCADYLVFNSAYNRDSFLSGVAQLLDKLPDEVPENVPAQLKEKAEILPVFVAPIKCPEQEGGVAGDEKLKNRRVILWNHRWEYDKAPQVFTDALFKLSEMNLDFELVLLGSRVGAKLEALSRIEQAFSGRIIVNQKVNSEDYSRYLQCSSIVVSTAIHEFQGLAVMEAISAGALPIVPDDLCYREQYDEIYRYPAGDSDALAEKMALFLSQDFPLPDITYWHSDKLVDDWCQLLEKA